MYCLDGADDTNEAYLKVGLKTVLNPSLSVNWDWDEANEAGLFYVVAILRLLDPSERLCQGYCRDR